jgi:dephospho-CoA kinase
MNANNICIGLTGPIGAGKSTVARLLEQEGAKIIDADLLAREVLSTKSSIHNPNSTNHQSLLDQIVLTFGTEILTENLELNRKKLANIIFNNQKAKEKLESLIHPAIYKAYCQKRDKLLAQNNDSIIVYDAALLLSSKFTYPELQMIVLVAADQELCIQRIMQRNSITREEALLRIKNQMQISEQIKKADWIIWNNYPNEEIAIKNLKIECKKLVDHLKKLYREISTTTQESKNKNE